MTILDYIYVLGTLGFIDSRLHNMPWMTWFITCGLPHFHQSRCSHEPIRIEPNRLNRSIVLKPFRSQTIMPTPFPKCLSFEMLPIWRCVGGILEHSSSEKTSHLTHNSSQLSSSAPLKQHASNEPLLFMEIFCSLSSTNQQTLTPLTHQVYRSQQICITFIIQQNHINQLTKTFN